MVTVRLPEAIRRYAKDQGVVELYGSTVREVLDALVAAHPDTRIRLFDDDGRLRSHLHVFSRETEVPADELDITRETNRHLSFGNGPHTCLGLQLTRVETRIALERLFTRYPRLSLGVPEETLRWQGRTALRALTRLPLRLGAAA